MFHFYRVNSRDKHLLPGPLHTSLFLCSRSKGAILRRCEMWNTLTLLHREFCPCSLQLGFTAQCHSFSAKVINRFLSASSCRTPQSHGHWGTTQQKLLNSLERLLFYKHIHLFMTHIFSHHFKHHLILKLKTL